MIEANLATMRQEKVDTREVDMQHCRHCGQATLIKNGFSPNGKQKYRCQTCQRQSRDAPQERGYSAERRDEILRAYEERSSLRGVERTFGVSRATIISWLKKKRSASHHSKKR